MSYNLNYLIQRFYSYVKTLSLILMLTASESVFIDNMPEPVYKACINNHWQ